MNKQEYISYLESRVEETEDEIDDTRGTTQAMYEAKLAAYRDAQLKALRLKE